MLSRLRTGAGQFSNSLGEVELGGLGISGQVRLGLVLCLKSISIKSLADSTTIIQTGKESVHVDKTLFLCHHLSECIPTTHCNFGKKKKKKLI